MLKLKYKVIGVMSGTSLDGIDIIYATFDFDEYWKFEIKETITFPYSEHWKKMLSHLTGESMKSLQDLDEDYSTFLAEQIQIFIDSNKIENIDFIASHGHTALHQPERGLTYQI